MCAQNAIGAGGCEIKRGEGRQHNGSLFIYGYHFLPGAGAGGGSPGFTGYKLVCGCTYGDDHREDNRMFKTDMCGGARKACWDLAVLVERMYRFVDVGILKFAWASVEDYLKQLGAKAVPRVGRASRSFAKADTKSTCTAAAVSTDFESSHHVDARDVGPTAILWVDDYSDGFDERNDGMFCFLEYVSLQGARCRVQGTGHRAQGAG